MSKYTVSNMYGINGESNHNTAEAACNAAAKHEGVGWIVTDADGNRWDMQKGADKAYITEAAE